jgi:hypothetical protein
MTKAPILILLLSLISANAIAQESTLNKKSWVQLAAQTCMQQAPKNAVVKSLNLSNSELRTNCHCVAKDMWVTLPLKERQQLHDSMQKQQSLHKVSERLMARSDVKQAVLACSAAAWWG